MSLTRGVVPSTKPYLGRPLFFTHEIVMVGNWVPMELGGSSFAVGYRLKGPEKQWITSVTPPRKGFLEHVVVKQVFWNPLFLVPVEWRRHSLDAKAIRMVSKKYGQAVSLDNKVYLGRWNRLSLLFYFSTLGIVEDASLEADAFSADLEPAAAP